MKRKQIFACVINIGIMKRKQISTLQCYVHIDKKYKAKGEGWSVLEHGTFYSRNISIKMEATSNISIHISLHWP